MERRFEQGRFPSADARRAARLFILSGFGGGFGSGKPCLARQRSAAALPRLAMACRAASVFDEFLPWTGKGFPAHAPCSLHVPIRKPLRATVLWSPTSFTSAKNDSILKITLPLGSRHFFSSCLEDFSCLPETLILWRVLVTLRKLQNRAFRLLMPTLARQLLELTALKIYRSGGSS